MSRDLVQETSSTTGTGAITLAGATAGHHGHQTFAAAGFVEGDVIDYTIFGLTAGGARDGSVEVGVGTLDVSGNLVRSSVAFSTNGNALVDFASASLLVVHGGSVAAIQRLAQGQISALVPDLITAAIGDLTPTGLGAVALTGAGAVYASNTISVDLSGAVQPEGIRDADGDVTINCTGYALGCRASVRIENTTVGAIAINVVAAVNWLGALGEPTTLAAGKVMRIAFVGGGSEAFTDAAYAVEA